MDQASDQLRIAAGSARNLHLFSEHFLRDVLPEWPQYADRDFESLRQQLLGLWHDKRDSLTGANEAQTEAEFIRPVLTALGFRYKVQSDLPVGAGRRQPDYALFLTEEAKEEADRRTGAMVYAEAVAVADAKRYGSPLTGRLRSAALSEDPQAQIIHYVSVTKCPWGILTNGCLWRLYAAAGDLVEGACYEVNLVQLLESDDPKRFGEFAAFFSASSFEPDAQGLSLLDRALDENEANTRAIGDALERQVFQAVPRVATGLLGEEQPTPAALAAVFGNALVFLYRLLFCLHAEARELLPVESRHYRDYSLRQQRIQLAEDIDSGRRFSRRSDDLYNDLRALFRILDGGDEDLGVNEYNGQLFSPAAHPYFEGRSIPDNLLAPALDGLFRVTGDQVDYRDLSVRHLGTIYEHLLAYELAPGRDGLELVGSSERKATGSYFTPRAVVDRIVERTLDPILGRCSKEVADAGLKAQDALDAFLELRVLDPAMGSGHFLVSAASYMAQCIATDPSYSGDLDLSEIQRRVAERCLYGVDLNPMAVELARLALWLTTVRDDEPLTFLGNLRTGNSLVGADFGELLAGERTVFAARLARDAEGMLDRIAEIQTHVSESGDAVHEKERLAAAVAGLRGPLEEFATEFIAPAFSNGVGRMFHWELEFPEVFLDAHGRCREDAGFDAIIGNPPYIRIQALGRELADFCRGRYETASGSFDAYIVFLERALSLLKPHGRLGFIVPNKFAKLDHAEKLRERFVEDRLVEEVIDFSDSQVFEGATNYTCILVLDRGGSDVLSFRKLPRAGVELREALTNPDSLPRTEVDWGQLSGEGWLLVTGGERQLLETLRTGAARLTEVTEAIFTGLQTGADRVYILEDRGMRGTMRRVFSAASEREFELEPDLLHPLASGLDVEPYAFRPLNSLLLFPYERRSGKTNLIEWGGVERLPATATYLREHEEALRGRERRKMNHAEWYAYTYPKSLGRHDSPKLGVPRLCERLGASADPGGVVYLDNVDVNGILIGDEGPSIWVLALLLNSRALDFVFRRTSVPFRGSFLSANKQFIAPLPIRMPEGAAVEVIEAAGRRLHMTARAIGEESAGFVGWVEAQVGTRIASLSGKTKLAQFDRIGWEEFVSILRRNRKRLQQGIDSRTFAESLRKEFDASAAKLADLSRSLAAEATRADNLVYDLYELTSGQRALIEGEYDRPQPPPTDERIGVNTR